jgi:zinc protease
VIAAARRLATIGVCTALLALAPAAAQTLPTGAAPPPVAQRTLANGLRVVVVQDHAAAVVQTAMWYGFGSLDEVPGKTGLAHGLEHMMFRGTHQVSGGGFDEIGARLGAIINADTNEDYTHYYTVMPADKVDLAIHLEADRIRGLLLRQSDWALEKGAVLSEYDSDDSQPVARLTEIVRATLYAGSPFARTPLGVREDIVRSTVEDLRGYYDHGYWPGDATLVVTGDVRPEAIFASAERWFSPIAAGPSLQRTPEPAPTASPKPSVATVGDYPYTVVDLAFRIPGDLGADAAATQVFANLVNSERSTFYRALVASKLTLAYQAFPDTSLHDGIFHVLLSVTPGRSADEARRAFETTLAGIRSDGVDPALLDAAKTMYARSAVYARDAISGLGDRYGYAYGVEGRDPSVDDKEVAALDTAAMNRAVRTYFAAAQVVGVLQPRAATPGAGANPSVGGAVSDDFSNRAPSGPIVLASWVQAALHEPPRISSHIDPRTFVLPNGLRLYVQPVHANPTVFVNGTIELSPAFDPPGKTGLGALASTLVAYGSARYDFEAQRRVADELGAEIQLGANFNAHGLARDLDRILDVLADGVQHPTYPPQYVALVRDQELAAISRRNQNPDYQADRAFASLLYAPGDPALRQETTASVRAIDVPSLRAYAQRYFRPDRTTIVVAGDLTSDDVHASIVRAFGAWATRGPRPEPHVPPLPPTRPVTRVIPAERAAVAVRMGQRAIPRTSPDFYAYNLLNTILGGGGTFDTRLMHEIRERRGLVYGVSSSLIADRNRGILEIDLGANPANVIPAITLVRSEVRRMTTQPVAGAELSRAKEKLIASTLVGEQSTQTIVSRLENIALYRLPPRYYATLGMRYGPIDPRSVLGVARRYIRPDDFATVFEGPPPRK